jgi:hypothetical protein
MRFFKYVAVAFFAVVLTVGLSACSKKAETDTSATTEENPATTAETPAADQTQATAPPAETPAAPTSTTTKTKTTTTTTKTTTSSRAVNATAATPKSLELPAGTQFDVVMATPVDTRTSNVGDKIEAKLAAPLVVNGRTVANQDAMIRGEISELTRASRAKSEEDRAGVKFLFTSLETIDGEKVLHATVTNSEGRMIAKSTSTRDKLLIGGGALAGAVIGKVAGKDTKSTILGAVGGAVLGTGVVLAAKGHELEVPAGSKVSLRVDEPITIVEK